MKLLNWTLFTSLLLLPLPSISNDYRPRVIALVSLEGKTHWENKLIQNIETDFKTEFKKLYPDQNVLSLFYTKADSKKLWDALQDKRTQAIIWVSHGAYNSSNSILTSAAAIVDYQGFDITPVFSGAHPSLKFLSVVGCQGKQILEKRLGESFFSNRKNLVVDSYDYKISAHSGIQYALQKLKQIQFLPSQMEVSEASPSSEIIKEIPLTIRRKFNSERITQFLKDHPSIEEFPSVRIEVNGKVVGVFEKQLKDNLLENILRVNLKLDSETPLSSQLKILITTGDPVTASLEKIEIGDFEIHVPFELEEYQWKLFAKPNGYPIGVSKRIFNYQLN